MMRLICRFSLLYHEKEHGTRDTIRDVIEPPFFRLRRDQFSPAASSGVGSDIFITDAISHSDIIVTRSNNLPYYLYPY